MNALGTRMLCKYSVSEVFKANVLRACPLQLDSAEAKECPCRKRIYVTELRVLSCTFSQPPGEKPKLWDGKEILNPSGLSKAIKQKVQKSKPMKKGKAKNMSTELTTQTDAKKPQSMDFAVMTFDRQMAYRMYSKITDVVGYVSNVGKWIYDSKMFGVTNVEQGRMMALCAFLEGRSPFEYAKTYHIIESKLTMRSEAMLAGFRDRGGDHNQLMRDENGASIELVKGKKKQTYTFTWAMALKEDFVFTKAAIGGQCPKALADGTVNPQAIKDNYRTPWRRTQMLWARVVSDACTAFCPEVKAGCYTPEEFDAVMDPDGNIIEAEFTEVANKGAENQVAAANAPTTYEQAAAAKPEPKVEPKPEAKVEPTPEVKPAATTPTTPTTTELAPIVYPDRGAAGFDEFQTALLTHLKRLKPMLLTDEEYKGVMAKKGVASAKDLSLQALHEFVMKLEDKAKAAGKISETEYGIIKAMRPAGN